MTSATPHADLLAALEKLDDVMAKQPLAGKIETGTFSLHNDWRGWWRKLFTPCVEALRAALSATERKPQPGAEVERLRREAFEAGWDWALTISGINWEEPEIVSPRARHLDRTACAEPTSIPDPVHSSRCRGHGAQGKGGRGVSEVQPWTDLTARLVARFDIASTFGMNAIHNEQGAKAIADLMRTMAKKLDAAVSVLDAREAQAYRQGVEDAAKVADAAKEARQRDVGDWKDVDQPHTVAEAWEYAADEAEEIAAAIRSLPDKKGA